ncbi:DUF362 domain-containing protein [Lentzea sp. NPDC058450]|uniref:DUF362 domain-containing protein n=1 Tax=Lentzea sp. NPDC058450 TaxID=3346505 RepID=UPI0036576403
MRREFRNFDEVLALSEQELAARTVGIDYPGSIDDLRPLLDWNIDGQRAAVSMTACAGYNPTTLREALKRGFDLLGVGDNLANARKIVVKVGLIEASRPEEHVTAHPLLMRELVLLLRETAPSGASICIADGSGHERDTAHLLNLAGVQAVLDELRIPFVDLNTDDLRVVETPQPMAFREFVLPRTITDADFVISLAKIKTHHRAGVTLGMKNLFGCVPGSVYGFPKTRLHYAGVARVIADLQSVVKPQLTVLDGVVAMEGTGPLDGSPVDLGAIVISKNTAAADAVTARHLGFAISLLPQFWYCLDKGLLPRPTVVGDEQQVLTRPFEPPNNIGWLRDTANQSIEQQTALLARLLSSAHPS